MKKNKLYLAHWDAEYEKLMIQNLKKNNNNKVIELPKLMKHFRNYNQKIKKKNWNNKWFVYLHILLKLRYLNQDDILICNGYSIPGFIDLIKPLSSKKMLVLRDPVSILQKVQRKRKWLKPHQKYEEEILPYFDLIFSFDKSDCRRYGFIYIEQFLPFTFAQFKELRKKSELNKNVVPCCFFVGQYRPLRAEILNKLALELNKLNYETNFNLLADDAEKQSYDMELQHFNWHSMSYLENIEISLNADVLVEINFAEQSGPSLRAIEALLLNKKLITTNKNIAEYEFFNPDQIFILENNYEELPVFLNKGFQAIPVEQLYAYSADGFIEKMINSI